MTRYELRDRIGVGGMAEVFRGKAVAAGGFEKPVAIKRILPHLSQDERFVELLIREAKVLSLLKHRNIVQIFDVGLGDDGKYFLVMEYVDGRDLGAIQRGLEAQRRRIPFDLALYIGAEICEALEHAHSSPAPDGKPMAVVHRDVSPSNVLLSRAGEVKLTDFGIAKRAEQEATRHGAIRGKCAYISPEQARNEPLEPSADVFSVGILLWELVTGRRLFSALSDMEALRAVREARAPRPRDVDPRLSADVDALIMSALSAEPRARPTAGQLCAQLRSLRYALDVTVGDPATELAKIIDATEEVERDDSPKIAVPRREFDGNDATVIRIHTADAFSTRDKDGAGMARARDVYRQVLDRFEEEETRQARLSYDQRAFLRASVRDSGELSAPVDPPLPGVRSRRPSDEPTRARAPLEIEDLPTTSPAAPVLKPSFDVDGEATKLLASPERRTPGPERGAARRPSGATPLPLPDPAPGARGFPRTPAPSMRTPTPGAVRDRGGRAASGAGAPPPVDVGPAPVLPPPGGASGMMSPMLSPGASAMSGGGVAPPGSGMAPIAPAGNYPSWVPTQLPPSLAERAAPTRRATSQQSQFVRRRPLRPWMLLLGALIMALLAFAITRACINSAANHPASESR